MAEDDAGSPGVNPEEVARWMEVHGDIEDRVSEGIKRNSQLAKEYSGWNKNATLGILVLSLVSISATALSLPDWASYLVSAVVFGASLWLLVFTIAQKSCKYSQLRRDFYDLRGEMAARADEHRDEPAVKTFQLRLNKLMKEELPEDDAL